MKLSEAIRKGSKLRPKCTGKLFKRVDSKNYYSCALGAAYEATFRSKKNASTDRLAKKYSILNKILTLEDLKETGYYFGQPLSYYIWRLNDCSGWSREKIADWVEKIEKKYGESECN